MKQLGTTLALLVGALLLASCGETAQQTNTPETAPTAVTEAVTEEVETAEVRPESGLPEMDFGGKAYRIAGLYEDDRVATFSDGEDGEAVNDAVYARNAEVCDRYNFTISYELVGHEDHNAFASAIKKAVTAGDDCYDLTYGHVVTQCNSAVAGMFLNWYDINYVDFTKPWYPAQSVEEMTVYGKMYTICSAINYIQLAQAKVLFVNKDIIRQNDMELPYDWVRNGTWTIEKLIEQTKDMYRDTNGDGQRDADDQYGYATYPSQNGFLVSCNTPVLSVTADGGREISVMTERTQKLVELVYDWYYEGNDVFLTESEDMNAKPFVGDVFGYGHAAYAFSKLYVANKHFRASDISYGIIPMPKFDEAQEEYYVFACPSLFSVPITAGDTDFSGFVFEALTYAGYYDVIPKYFEITLKGKVADSPDDAEMLTLINDSLTVSFAYCYDNWEGFAHLFNSRMGFSRTRGSKDLASVYTKNLKRAQKRLDKVLGGFAD